MEAPIVTTTSEDIPISTTNDIVSEEPKSTTDIVNTTTATTITTTATTTVEEAITTEVQDDSKNEITPSTTTTENNVIEEHPHTELTWESVAAEINDQSDNYEIITSDTHTEIITTESVIVSSADDLNKSDSTTTSEVVVNEVYHEETINEHETVDSTHINENNLEMSDNVVHIQGEETVNLQEVEEAVTLPEETITTVQEESVTSQEESITSQGDESIALHEESIGVQEEAIAVVQEEETVTLPEEEVVRDDSGLHEESVQEETITEETVPIQEETVTASESSQADKSTEEIEITELKPGEETEVHEVIEGVEYTVIEAEDDIMSQDDSCTENIVLLPEDAVMYENLNEVVIKNEEKNNDPNKVVYVIKAEEMAGKEAEKKKKPRGRKPISDIPLHVLGRDISKPTEGVSNGGRVMPKPRLGVKVPYKNLTSQIVSKDEIQKEIMERFKQKQEQNTPSGDILFARRLTQRLAKKLIPSDKKDEAESVLSNTQSEEENTPKKTPAATMNNSDLIAILEGDDDPVTVAQHTDSQVFAEKEQFVKDIEKKIALEQLKELPISNKNRIFKSRSSQEKHSQVSKTTNQEGGQQKSNDTQKKTNESNEKTKSAENTSKNQKSDKKVDIEPQIKAEQVVKTYTRKRKSFELDVLPPKKALAMLKEELKDEVSSSPDVYITKSSRVIKKKVIWDPDEVPSKSPTKALKPVEQKPKSNDGKSPKTIEKSTKADSKIPKPTDKVSKQNDSKPKATESKKSETSQKPKVESPQKTKTIESPTKSKPVEKKTDKDDKTKTEKKTDKEEKVFEKKVPTPLKKSISPMKKVNKRISEVDRLLMDEGAVNMLYDVNNDSPNKKRSKDVISLDKAHKELMSKTSVIKNELQKNTNTEQPKALRKKESPSPKSVTKKEIIPGVVSRKKSKDSTKSSVHSPPASPGFSPAEASRIIRRHSSSSFSSNDELDDKEERSTKKNKSSTISASSNNSTEPPKKKLKKSVDSGNKTNEKEKEKKSEKYDTFTVIRNNKLVSIEFNCVDSKYYLTEGVLKELTVCLKELGKDNDCHVVCFTSNNTASFCNGFDYKCLVVKDTDARKKKAIEISTLIKDFLRCLLHFPKVLVAGIQGECIGLGATMLPLFDLVIASDTSTFSIPSSSLGCAAEGGFLLTVPHRNSHGLASELLYTSQTIKAEDAVRGGLITRLCWPEKYHNELKNTLTTIAKQSRQSIEANKVQLRQHLFHSIETILTSTMKVLVEQWQSDECQKNFSQYREEVN